MSIGRMFVFLAVFAGITFGWHYYLWIRLVRDPAWGGWSRAITWLIFILAASMPLSFILMRLLPREVTSPVMWIEYTWMGLAFILLFVLIPLDMARAAASHLVPMDPERRLFLARALALGATSIGTVMTAVGFYNVKKRVGIVHVPVHLVKLPPALSGYTIVQLSDVHVGPTIGKDFIEEIVQTANAQNPDIVVITGDLVDGSVADLGAHVAPLKNLRAKDGVFFVTGNHEYYSGVDEWLSFLTSLGIRVLRNERVPLRSTEGGGLDLAGVDDHTAHQFGHGHGVDLPKALDGRDRSRALVLLAHQPKTILQAIAYGIDLQLSGHTHGGQIWPWGYAVKLDQPHVAGLARHGDAWIYTSRGTGYWGPPVRVKAPAEVTRIELRPA